MIHKKKQQSSLVGYLIASTCAHALIAAAFFMTYQIPPRINLERTTIKTSLVKKALPQEKELMPRKVEKEPEPESVKAVEPIKPKEEKRVAKVAEKKVETQQKTKPKVDVKDRLNKLARSFARSESDSPLISSQELEGEISDSYLLHVQELIKEAFELPAVISYEERKRLKLMARIYIDAQGRLINLKFEKPSGNHTFDSAIERASKAISSFGAPPLQMRSRLQKIGEVVTFCPLECR